MSDKLVVYGFDTSNNFKVRVALGYKGIPYELVRIDPGDRSTVLRLSGQPLTPIIVHEDRVLFDSAAILRYLDANFPDTPRLFPPDRELIQQIEEWESFARRELHEPIKIVMRQRIEKRTDEAELARAAAAFAATTGQIEERLRERDWLVDERMTAADATAAPVVFRCRALAAFALPAERPRTYAWVERVMAFDQPPA